MPTININSVKANSQVILTGLVDFSRIASHLEGAELEADNAKKKANGMNPVDRAHTRITIKNAIIEYANPNEPTRGEQYIAERLYTSKAHPDKGMMFTAMNKSRNLPNLFCRENATVKQIEPVTATAELATGVPVTIVLRFFTTDRNSGVSLDSVIVNEKPVRWYTGSTTNALTERGFTIVDGAPSVNEVRDQLAAPVTPVAPVPALVAPVAPVAPTPVPTAVAPATTAVPVSAVAPAPAPSLPTPPPGYMYDESGRLVVIPNNGDTTGATGGIRL